MYRSSAPGVEPTTKWFSNDIAMAVIGMIGTTVPPSSAYQLKWGNDYNSYGVGTYSFTLGSDRAAVYCNGNSGGTIYRYVAITPPGGDTSVRDIPVGITLAKTGANTPYRGVGAVIYEMGDGSGFKAYGPRYPLGPAALTETVTLKTNYLYLVYLDASSMSGGTGQTYDYTTELRFVFPAQ